MKSQIYNQAKYYEIAFSFINAKKQVVLFEKFIKKYSRVKVKSVLDIACGPALQLRELAKKNYEATGIDYNSQMINYLNKVSTEKGLKINALKADMNNFKLKRKFDFAYIMMGSIIYAKNNQLFLSHLNSVANSLKSGGLYLIENISVNWSDPSLLKPQSWTIKRGGIKIKVTYHITPKKAIEQIVTQRFKMEVNDNGKKQEYVNQCDLKLIFPEELKLLVEKNKQFEFLGFFERNSLKKLKNISADNIVLLRKK